jgi:hypothetical protein
MTLYILLYNLLKRGRKSNRLDLDSSEGIDTALLGLIADTFILIIFL